MSQTVESYVIKKNSWAPFARIGLLWHGMKGFRVMYLMGIVSLLFEAFFVFSSPVILQVTIDSVIGSRPPVIPFTLLGPAEWLLGRNVNGGGILRLPDGYGVSSGWVWRAWIRDNLWSVSLAFIGCIVLQSFFSFWSSFCSNFVAENSAKAMRDRLYGHVQDLPYETLLRAQSGDWLQRCTSDVDTARRFICYESMELCRTVFLILFALPVLYSLCLPLALWGCLVIPIIVLFSFGFHKIVERVFLGADEREGVLSGIIQENVTGVRVVRAFARKDYEIDRFALANDRFRDQVFKLIAWLAVFWSVSSFLGLFQLSIVLGVGLRMMRLGTLSLGLLILFLSYEQQILWPIRQFGRVLADIGKTKVALGRMAELLSLSIEDGLDESSISVKDETEKLSGERHTTRNSWARGAIEFDGVSFTYPDGTSVLHDISFTIKSGERLAIVGPTGSGKSTLIHLLARLYEPTEGTIRIGGRDIRTIPKRVLRREIALVLQEGFLYGKSIRENIRMGNKAAGEESLVQAARKAAFHHVVEGFTGGYDTMVGERGVTLSGGQRQRLALARALVREAPVLVLDDSLSAVDTETDRVIRESIDGMEQRASMIIIAHRLTTLASADQIVVLEGGRITGSGSHEELIARPGLYRRLAELQRATADGEEQNV